MTPFLTSTTAKFGIIIEGGAKMTQTITEQEIVSLRVCAKCGKVNKQKLWASRTWVPGKCERCGEQL